MLLLQFLRQEVSEGIKDEQSHSVRVLEGHREGQEGVGKRGHGGDEEDPGLLQRQGSKWRKDRLGHA